MLLLGSPRILRFIPVLHPRSLLRFPSNTLYISVFFFFPLNYSSFFISSSAPSFCLPPPSHLSTTLARRKLPVVIHSLPRKCDAALRLHPLRCQLRKNLTYRLIRYGWLQLPLAHRLDDVTLNCLRPLHLHLFNPLQPLAPLRRHKRTQKTLPLLIHRIHSILLCLLLHKHLLRLLLADWNARHVVKKKTSILQKKKKFHLDLFHNGKQSNNNNNKHHSRSAHTDKNKNKQSLQIKPKHGKMFCRDADRIPN
ncbi:hypothetical protein TCSYLVIO_002631 [Trypanosoma cruzi]|nr:hypothetical protein TCSYLVIO_002631 [Trypanosoma cruzi]